MFGGWTHHAPGEPSCNRGKMRKLRIDGAQNSSFFRSWTHSSDSYSSAFSGSGEALRPPRKPQEVRSEEPSCPLSALQLGTEPEAQCVKGSELHCVTCSPKHQRHLELVRFSSFPNALFAKTSILEEGFRICAYKQNRI